MIEYRDVQAAQARIASHIIRTPLLRVPALDEALGCQVYLKHEGFQAIGAFKIRGALNKALSLSEEELGRGLVCASSGNHAQGVAYAAHKLGAQAVIVMPTNANPVKLAGVQRWGGQVELVGTLSSQREERAAQLVREQGMVEIHPYADPFVAAGQGTLALEVLEDLPDASLIAAPIGGGGLISGIATAVKGAAPQVRTVGVEPAGAPRYTRSRAEGRPVQLESVQTIADGTRTDPRQPGQLRRHPGPGGRAVYRGGPLDRGGHAPSDDRRQGDRRALLRPPRGRRPVRRAPCPAGGQGGVRPVRRQRRSGSVGPAAGLTALRSVTLSQKARRSCAMLNIPSKGEEAQRDAL